MHHSQIQRFNVVVQNHKNKIYEKTILPIQKLVRKWNKSVGGRRRLRPSFVKQLVTICVNGKKHRLKKLWPREFTHEKPLLVHTYHKKALSRLFRLSLFSKSLWSAFDQITHISTMAKLIHHPPIRFQFQPLGSKSVSKWPFSRKPISISRSSNSVPKSRFSRKRWALKNHFEELLTKFLQMNVGKINSSSSIRVQFSTSRSSNSVSKWLFLRNQ